LIKNQKDGNRECDTSCFDIKNIEYLIKTL